MLKLIKKYESLDDDAKNVIHTLVLSPIMLAFDEIADAIGNYYTLTDKRIQSILDRCVKFGLVKVNSTFTKRYIIDDYMRVWIYPLIINDKPDKTIKSTVGFYYYDRYDALLDYLSALVHKSKTLEEQEIRLFMRADIQIRYLSAIFEQPAYEKRYPDISGKLICMLYKQYTQSVIREFGNLEKIQQLDEKLKANASKELRGEQAEIAFRRGDFSSVLKTSLGLDIDTLYFAKAITSFFSDKIEDALEFFGKGIKKQRRIYSTTYLPLINEVALFYIVAWLSKDSKDYTLVFRKIVEKRNSKYYNETTMVLIEACDYFTQDAERSMRIADYFREIETNKSSELNLWKIIALGLVGEHLNHNKISAAKTLIMNAYQNGYFPAAYEAAYTLLKETESLEIREIYDDLSQKLKYAPLLSQVKTVEIWEKQLSTYLMLESVQLLVRKEEGIGNARVAYRFYPKRNAAQPILQSRQADGNWTAGRNISMDNFKRRKVECMMEQDKRIAAIEAKKYYTYEIATESLTEMTGHPYVYLEDSNIPVELIASQPVLSIAKLKNGSYKLECDVTDIRNNVLIVKETNTRYKVYTFTAPQREIINAIANAKNIPEQGFERLQKVLKHFSTYIGIQSDLLMNENDGQARQVEPDSRIHIQILPFGDGLKTELFVKPFGTHPPYCKPGRGGKALMAYDNGERVQVIRNIEQENQYNEILLNDIQSIESLNTTNGLMSFDNPYDSLDLLEILERHQAISVVEWPEGERIKIRKSVQFGDFDMRVSSGVDWFALDGELRIDENTILSIKDLLELVRQGQGRFVELSNGEFLALSEQLRRSLLELAAFSSGAPKGVKINRFASESLVDVFNDFENLKVDKAWNDFRKRIETVQQAEVAVPVTLKAELRPYQVAGYQWMIRLAEWGAGACLADDMGLGKTVQAIAVLLQRAQRGPSLVVSPVSVQPNWVNEVRKFAPSLVVKTLNEGTREETLASLVAGDLLITSYGLLLSEETSITAIQWATIVLDEAHAIKNYTTKTSKAVMSLQAEFRMILTGTPIQNHLGEIWNLFNFINPGLLGTLQHFTDKFIKPGKDAHKSLKKLITPFILRRTKTAVLDELPPKTEIIRKIELSNEEHAFYEALRRKAIETLASDEGTQGAKHLKTLAEITRLRQACCNPALVEPKLGIESTKLSTFLEIVGELKENGHRALVFSQFVSHLSIVRKALDEAGFTYQYLDGSTPTLKRAHAVNNFQSGKDDLFLISLKAGGLGLNLTAADYVIHLDPWWNPAVEDQASDRAHRIGQTRPVTVYRLVAENTIEEKIIQLHNTKRDLADSLLEGSDQSAKLSIAELMALIKEE
jgi:SNF2 family DNA or RNA helicase